MRKKPRCEIGRSAPQDRGTVAVIVALLLIPLTIAVGLAVESVRAYQAKSALQGALDSGVLAAGANARLSDEQSKAMIESYVKANTQGLAIDPVQVSFAVETRSRVNVLVASATTSIETFFLRIIGTNRLTLRADTEVRRAQPGPVQVVLVLDATASMELPLDGGNRLDALKAAATELADIIMDPPNQGGGIGLVPFSLFVNLGLTNLGGMPETWVTIPASQTICDYTTECYVGCIRDGAPTTCIQLDPKPAGCIESNCRASGFGCVSYRSRPYRTTIADQITNKHRGVVAICAPPSREIMNNKSTIVKRIDELHTVPIETHIPVGLMWGWNMLTPDLPIQGPPTSAVEDRGGRRAIILISDGENRHRPDDSDNGFFVPWTSGTAVANRNDDPDILTAEICDNITADTNDPQIEIYTVLIGDQPSSMVTLMENCASDRTKAFTAATRQDLIEHFKLIGEQLSTVRLNK